MSGSDHFRIAVDARPLSHPGTGIYRYTRELLTRMTAMGGQWYLYSSQSYARDGLEGDNIVHRSLNVPTYLGGSQASQILFPYWIKRDALPLFWGPRHHLPLALPAQVSAVLTVHDLVWEKQPESMRATRRWAERLLMPKSVKRADSIVTVSNCVAAQLKISFPDIDSRLSVIWSASSFIPSVQPQQAPVAAEAYLLFVGTMEPRKNLPRLLRAYKKYTAKTQSARPLKVVGGGGWGGVDPVRLVDSLGLAGKVEVLGGIPDKQLASLYRGAYALLMPSLYEGFGLPVVEALTHGVPALVSANSALSEVAAEAGYPVDPLSEESITQALCVLTEDVEVYNRLRTCALPRAACFSWDKSAADMYALLRNCA